MKINAVERKRIWVFLAVTFGWSWTIALVLWLKGGLQADTSAIPGIPGYLIYLVIFMFGPAVGHIATRLITGEGWQDTKLRPHFKRGWKFSLLAWLGTPLLIGVGTFVFYLVFPEYFDPTMAVLSNSLMNQGISLADVGMSVELLAPLMVLQATLTAPIVNVFFILGEEFGWRAYLQPKLMPLGTRRALLISSVIWGLWHAPIIAMGYNYGSYTPDYFGAPWSGILMMTLATVWLGIFFGWLSYKAGSVWPAVIGHGSLNGIAAISIYFSQGTPPLLLGPIAVGLLGGSGFILVSLLIWFMPNALADEQG